MTATKHEILSLAALVGMSVWGLGGCESDGGASTHTVAGTSGHVGDDDAESETVITLNDLPAAVRESLGGVTSESTVTQITRDEGCGGTSYDVEYTRDGAQWAAEFTPAGELLENERDGENDDDGED